MLTKKDYRSFFAQCKHMLKMKYFLEIAGISPVNFSRFMKSSDFDWCMSVESLDKLYFVITDTLNKIA